MNAGRLIKFQSFFAGLVVMVGLFLCDTQAFSADMPNYKWTAALNVAESTINYKIVQKFKDLIEAKSGGKIIINIYANGQLGGDKEMMEGLTMGNIDFSSTITTGLVDFVPENAVFDLPSAFPNIDVMRKVLDSPFKDLMNKYNAKGNIMLLGYADAGFRQTTSNKEVRSATDIEGMKIRVMQNPYHITYWKSLGANALAMDFSEVYIALQQGQIDAQENPYMNIVANKFYEAQKYVIETNHVGHIIVFVMNNTLYKGLPSNVRALVDDCSKEAVSYGRGLADESIASDKKIITDNKVEIIKLSSADLEKMKKMAEPVYKQIRAKVGDELVDAFLKQVDAAM